LSSNLPYEPLFRLFALGRYIIRKLVEKYDPACTNEEEICTVYVNMTHNAMDTPYAAVDFMESGVCISPRNVLPAKWKRRDAHRKPVLNGLR